MHWLQLQHCQPWKNLWKWNANYTVVRIKLSKRTEQNSPVEQKSNEALQFIVFQCTYAGSIMITLNFSYMIKLNNYYFSLDSHPFVFKPQWIHFFHIHSITVCRVRFTSYTCHLLQPLMKIKMCWQIIRIILEEQSPNWSSSEFA